MVEIIMYEWAQFIMFACSYLRIVTRAIPLHYARCRYYDSLGFHYCLQESKILRRKYFMN